VEHDLLIQRGLFLSSNTAREDAPAWSAPGRKAFGGEIPIMGLPELHDEDESAAEQTADATGDGLRVLVIEDNRDGARALALLLRLWGHQVRIAHDGLAGLKAADAFRPEVVLSDIGLPGMDGYEVARRLRSELAIHGALLISVTAYGTQDVRLRALASGFNHHLVKPLDPKTLHKLLNDMMHRKTAGWRAPVAALPAAEHAAIVARADHFEFLQRKEDLFADGVATVFGVRHGQAEPQAFCFQAGKFSPRQAYDWLRERGFLPLLFFEAAGRKCANDAAGLHQGA
jgi:CheY-like chemotaxis protein